MKIKVILDNYKSEILQSFIQMTTAMHESLMAVSSFCCCMETPEVKNYLLLGLLG